MSKDMTDRSIREIEEMGSRLMERPAALQEYVFKRLFDQAEIAKYSPEERQDYEDSLRVYRDMKNVLDTAELKGLKKGIKQGLEQGIKQGLEQGIEQGIEQGALEEKRKNAKAMKVLGLPLETIARVTGMSAEDIAKL